MSLLWILVTVLACVFGRLTNVASQAPYTDQELDAFCDKQQCETGSACVITESPYLLFPVPFCKPPEDQQPDAFCGTSPPRVIGGDPLNCRTRDEFFQIASNECQGATYAAAFEVSESCLDYSSSGEYLYRFAQFFCCPSPTEQPTPSGLGTVAPSQSGSGLASGFSPSEDTSTEAPTSACLALQFSCSTSGECIPSAYRCDDITDCMDGSDEANCLCVANKFHCDDGIRIDASARCDSVNDCVNGTDEANCPSCTAPNRFTCDTGRCRPRDFRCDGDLDCSDGSDERGCEDVPCRRANLWRCPCVGLCISRLAVCDGRDDCGNNEDELPENCLANEDLAVEDGEGKTGDTHTSIGFVGKLVIGVGGAVGAVSMALLVVYVIRRRRHRQYESLASPHMKQIEDAEPETLSFHHGTWSGYGDHEEWLDDDAKALLISKEKTSKDAVFGYDNPLACDDFANDHDLRDEGECDGYRPDE